MVDRVSKEVRSQIMKSIRSKRTKLEEKVAKELWKRGFRFRRNVKTLFGTPDIAIKKYKLVIFIDSCFWHGCERHCTLPQNNREFWAKKINDNKERDKRVTTHYKNNGWHIIRIWEHELKEDFQQVIDNIEKLFNNIKNNY